MMFKKFKAFLCKKFGHKYRLDRCDFDDETVEFWYCSRCKKDLGVEHYPHKSNLELK